MQRKTLWVCVVREDNKRSLTIRSMISCPSCYSEIFTDGRVRWKNCVRFEPIGVCPVCGVKVKDSEGGLIPEYQILTWWIRKAARCFREDIRECFREEMHKPILKRSSGNKIKKRKKIVKWYLKEFK